MQLLFVLLVGGAQGFSPAVPPTATAAIRRRPSSPSVTKKFLSLDDFTEDELSGDDDPAVATAEGKKNTDADEENYEAEDQAAREFFAKLPQPTLEQLSVAVSDAERSASELTPEKLRHAEAVLRRYGVCRLQRAWAADDALVAPASAALLRHLESLAGAMEERGVGRGEQGSSVLDESFGFREIVHRSFGRYDMLLRRDDLMARRRQQRERTTARTTTTRSLLLEEQRRGDGRGDDGDCDGKGVLIMDAVLALPLWRQVLGRFLGRDHKINFTAALVARHGCLDQNPHMDGGHLFMDEELDNEELEDEELEDEDRDQGGSGVVHSSSLRRGCVVGRRGQAGGWGPCVANNYPR